MFHSIKLKLLLAVYILLIISIPVGTYVISQQQTSLTNQAAPSKKQEGADVKKTPTPSPKTSAKADLKKSLGETATKSPTPTAEPELTTTLPSSFGPTLSLKAKLEGRPPDQQKTKLFVGIVEGGISLNPKFLLSFSINLPDSGEFSNLSLAGLKSGSSYTALLKASSTIATSSAFQMSPTTTNLNSGSDILLLSGDLNEDNVINSSDYAIAKAILGATPKSAKWNENSDFNKDAFINIFDLAFILKNFGKTGASGAWVSTPKVATPSGALAPEATQSGGTNNGYWIWIPSY